MTGPQSTPQPGPPPATPPPSAPPPPSRSPAAPATPGPAATMPGFLAALSRAELVMAAGAALIVLVNLVFVIFGPYGFADIGWAGAVLALLLIFLNGRSATVNFSRETYRSLLVLIGGFMVILLIREIIGDVQFISGSRVDATYYLGALGFYAGVALMAFGAWQLWKGRAP